MPAEENGRFLVKAIRQRHSNTLTFISQHADVFFGTNKTIQREIKPFWRETGLRSKSL
jgi:hypothetical protein